ncbi:peptidoglycan/xylan/chitin deacetylase (PgdA/CDA1 family) [Cerasibacillus quisquiliarum]|uniref:NodB homology domain-containing protein n=1 Tax=Cerasibacillus quisquiliarum TaxID=227865 RepID=A0A511UUF7_9BACI|nr:polysaccharide deacetylase family protein [Cerasibacillus quisquiliarum]MBB5144881.1 peptidoglycan/xylan/chitin deacetylase (PgdA/CDA1 family) [Cerasibacillus quisquiliarum]GEN30227.1 hypothetical protein CQU01_04650 [Cerasibacillus quisquiliarum]
MAKIQHLLNKIRTAIYGKEVRGSLADGLEAINKETEDATEVAVNVEQRQDAVEQQFDDVLNEWTSDKPISNEETIAARTNRNTGENHQTLGQRLDAENKKVSAQLADNKQLINKNRNDIGDLGTFVEGELSNLKEYTDLELDKRATKTQVSEELNKKADEKYVNVEVEKVRKEIADIVTTPADGVNQQEIINAREGKKSLGANMREIRKRTNASLQNVMKNGDFKEDNLNNFGVFYGNMRLSKFEDDVDDYHSVVLTSNGSSDYFGASIYQTLQSQIPQLDKWYVKARMRAVEDVHDLTIGVRGIKGIKHPVSENAGSVKKGVWYDVSYLFDPEKEHNLTGEFRVFACGIYPSGQNTSGKRVEVDNILAINLTKFFGYGNEPTKDQMDKLLENYPYRYFDEESDAGNLSSANLKEMISHKREIERMSNELEIINNSSLKNGIDNGNFENENGGKWRTESGTTWEISNNTMKIIGLGTSTIPRISQETPFVFRPGKIVYIRFLGRVTSQSCERLGIATYSDVAGNTIQYAFFNDFKVNEQKVFSATVTMPEEGKGNIRVQVRAQYPDATSSDGNSVEVQKVLAIDLTETFGAGSEPTKEQMDEIINNLPNQWFDDRAKVADVQKSFMSYVFNKKDKGGAGLKRPLIAITFDDGFRSDIDLVYPEFKQRGITGTSYIWTDRTDNYAGAMNPDDLIKLKLNGWGIECHTRDHLRLAELSDQEIHEQFQAVNQDFERYGLPLPQHHALPFGSGGNVKRVQDIVMQYRKSCRNIHSNSSGIYNDWDTIDFSALNARSADITDANPHVVDLRKSDIDLTIEKNGILILIVHKVSLETNGQYEAKLEHLLSVVDYAIEKGMKFVTLDEMYERVKEYQNVVN